MLFGLLLWLVFLGILDLMPLALVQLRLWKPHTDPFQRPRGGLVWGPTEIMGQCEQQPEYL